MARSTLNLLVLAGLGLLLLQCGRETLDLLPERVVLPNSGGSSGTGGASSGGSQSGGVAQGGAALGGALGGSTPGQGGQTAGGVSNGGVPGSSGGGPTSVCGECAPEDCEKGRCQRCGPTGRSCPSEAQKCDSSGKCVECFDDRHCGRGRCENSFCKQCLTNEHCKDFGKPFCNDDFGICVDCLSRSDCLVPGLSECAWGQCVECWNQDQCPIDLPHCSPVGECVSVSCSDSDCRNLCNAPSSCSACLPNNTCSKCGPCQ